MDVTVEQLTEALTEFRTAVRPDGGRVGDVQPGWIAYPAELAETLIATLSRMAALREPDGEPSAHAHSCDDQCPADPELHAMALLLPAMPLVSKLSPDARARVMDWARSRACDGLPPF